MSFWSGTNNTGVPRGLTANPDGTYTDRNGNSVFWNPDYSYSEGEARQEIPGSGKWSVNTPIPGGSDENGNQTYRTQNYLEPGQDQLYGAMSFTDPSFFPQLQSIIQQTVGGQYSQDQINNAITSSSWFGKLGSGSNPYNAALEVAQKLGADTSWYNQGTSNLYRARSEANSPEARSSQGSESYLDAFKSLAPVLLPAIAGAYFSGAENFNALDPTGAGASASTGDGVSNVLANRTAAASAGTGDGVGSILANRGAGAAGAYGASAGAGLTAEEIAAINQMSGGAAGGVGAGVYGAGAAATGGSWMDSLLASAGKFGSTLMSAPVIGAGISTLGALYGASQIGKSATNAANTLGAANTNAANLASNASLAATDLQRQQFQRQQELQQPFYNAGVNALPAYASGVMPGGDLVKPFSMADYQADPGYGFRFDQGMKALNSSMASRGLGVSGPSIKGAINFGQGAASQEYQNAYNRYVNDQSTQRNALAGLTGYGPTSASTIGAAGQNYASNVGNMGMTTANTIGGMGTNTASQIANADLTGAAARQSAYGGSANAFNAALNPNPLNAFLARSIGNPYG